MRPDPQRIAADAANHRETKIRHAIKTAISGFGPFSETPDYDKLAAITREQAAVISEAVFDALEKGGFLSAGPATDRRMRITLVITEAIGHVDEPPDDHRPGRWWEQSRRPSWGLDEVADAIYANLAHRGYVAEERD
jgi:hypothetical protein